MIPATVVTGFLGAGKTTLILDAFRFRPPAERWAVVVNERGSVGIDGALLTAEGVSVREVAGGCVCCTAGLELRVALVSILREARPDRLFVEPSGAARPEAVLDVLRSPGIREVLAPRATLCLVDGRRLGDRRVVASDTFQAQLAVADTIVGSHLARQDVASRAALERHVAGLWPPRRLDWTDGAFDPDWLERLPGDLRPFLPPPGHDPLVAGGRIWPQDLVFYAGALEGVVQELVRPGLFPDGVLRIKALFRTERGWRRLDGTSMTLTWTPASWRGDSRVEILVREPPTDWEAVWQLLLGAAHPA